jgi:hypothetical protein
MDVVEDYIEESQCNISYFPFLFLYVTSRPTPFPVSQEA